MKLVCTLLLLFFFAAPSMAQQAEQESESAISEFHWDASQYTFRNAGSELPFDWVQQPLLHWSNPVRIGEVGALFLWTQDELPRVVGACFKYPHEQGERRKHEFHVLTDRPIEGKHGGTVMWTPTKGLEFHPLPGAPAPPVAATQRTIHLRNHARRFSVRVTEGQRTEETRLVPQPLYRYETQGDTPTSGAIFAYSLGTDPEALVILETGLDPDGKRVWHYALARLTFYQLDFFLDGQPLQTLEQSENLAVHIHSRPDYQRNPYIIFRAH
jgi:hypothetical protein